MTVFNLRPADFSAGLFFNISQTIQSYFGKQFGLEYGHNLKQKEFHMKDKEFVVEKIKFYLPLDLADKIAAGLEKQA